MPTAASQENLKALESDVQTLNSLCETQRTEINNLRNALLSLRSSGQALYRSVLPPEERGPGVQPDIANARSEWKAAFEASTPLVQP